MFNILMCPLANNWPLITMHLTTMQLIFGPRMINILMCPLANNWPPQYYALTTMQLIFGPKVDIQHFSVSLANNWPPQYYAPHYYAADLWRPRVDGSGA
jgi:hypothetical protein